MLPKLISCKVMIDEIRALLPGEIATEVLEISLHTRPALLREALQKAIDAADGHYDPILLGYGMCSKATIGLKARYSRLVVPNSDDCIAILLGSRNAHREEVARQPGTYFLSRGWIGSGGGSIFSEYEHVVVRFGEARAAVLMNKMLGHYKRLAYIRTPNAVGEDAAREYAQATARQFGMEYVELKGKSVLMKHLVDNQWDADCIVVEPEEEITLEHFLKRKEHV